MPQTREAALLQRIYILAATCALASLIALAGMALGSSFRLVFLCICLVALAGLGLVLALQKQRACLEQTGAALGNFMRGHWAARAMPDARDDACSRLQHRINNLLDTLDLHLRREDAAIDLAAHGDYAEKLRQSPLSEALANRETMLASQQRKETVGNFLQQLGDNVAELFQQEAQAGQGEKSAALTALGSQQRDALQQLEHRAARLAAASAQLAQRAVHPAAQTTLGAPTPAMLEQALSRMVELATVLALNVAIEAGRAPAGSSLHSAAEDIRSLVSQLEKARGHAAMLLPPGSGPEAPVSVPLSYAIEALANAEQALREQLEMGQGIATRLDELAAGQGEVPLTLEEAA